MQFHLKSATHHLTIANIIIIVLVVIINSNITKEVMMPKRSKFC